MKDELLHDAIKNWEVLSGTKEQRIAYEGRMKRILDEEAAVRELELRMEGAREEAVKAGRKVGMEEGIKEGIKEGMQKGIKEDVKAGMKEGRREAEKEAELHQQKIAQRLLTEGMAMEKVAEITGFTEAEIKEQLNKH